MSFSGEVIIFLITSNLLVLGLGAFLFVIMRIQQKRKILHKTQLLEQEFRTRQETISAISRDLHDDIGSSLSGISLFSQMALSQSKSSEQPVVHQMLTNIHQYSQVIIDRTADMVWMLQPENDSEEKYLERLQSYAAAITQPKSISLQFDIAEDFHLPFHQLRYRKNIYLICREAINNAVKYSDCSLLQVIFKDKEIFIKDDGKGFDNNTARSGNGLKNMQLRANESAVRLQISSSENGTVVTLSL